MIKCFLQFTLIIVFININLNKMITSENLKFIKNHEDHLKNNVIFSFLSGLFNDPMLLSSDIMTKCLFNTVTNPSESENFITKIIHLDYETEDILNSNLYSHLNHKFKVCDINRDNSQKLSIYFIDKLRTMFREVLFFPVAIEARKSLLCYKKQTNHEFSALIEEIFLNIEKFVIGYPETFCQLKDLMPILRSKYFLNNLENKMMRFFKFGQIYYKFLKTVNQHKRQCLNFLSDKYVFYDYTKFHK